MPLSLVAASAIAKAQVSVPRESSLSRQIRLIWRKSESSWEKSLRETYLLLSRQVDGHAIATVRQRLNAEGITELDRVPESQFYDFLLLNGADINAGDLQGSLMLRVSSEAKVASIVDVSIKWELQSLGRFDIRRLHAQGVLLKMLNSSHFKERLKGGRPRRIQFGFGPLYEPGISQEALGYTAETVFDREGRQFGIIYRAASGLDPYKDVSTEKREEGGTTLLRRGAFPEMPRISSAPEDDAIWVSVDGTEH